jgi:hypothetical protein
VGFKLIKGMLKLSTLMIGFFLEFFNVAIIYK